MSEEQINDTTTSEQNTDQEKREVDVEALKAENAKLTAIIKRRNEKKEETPDDTPITNNTNISDEKIERLELKLDGYPDAVIDQIMENGGKKFL